jgi:hypothetical protein
MRSLVQNCPAGHLSHAVCPAATWYSPGTHVVQLLAPGEPLILPGEQSRQTAALLLPGMGFAFPAGHAMHALLLNAPAVGL